MAIKKIKAKVKHEAFGKPTEICYFGGWKPSLDKIKAHYPRDKKRNT
jgi:hypothetical protein